jgi:ribulose-phosphate 3-epimerase
MKKILVAPSMLSADFANLEKEIRRVQEAGADWLHIDVMDGHFVPNITIGPVVVKAVKRAAKVPLDVHLMISDPEKYVVPFAQAGSDLITFHVEAIKDVGAIIAAIKINGKKAGISIKPDTDIADITPYLNKVDLVLVMSVEPGFGGQDFMDVAIPKIRQLRKLYRGDISVDGGINDENAALVKEAGANVLVAGSYIFRAKDIKEAVRRLRA